MPGLAVDDDGMRLGRGGGCYDRALGRVPVGTFTCVLLYDDGWPGSRRAPRPAGHTASPRPGGPASADASVERQPVLGGIDRRVG